MKSFTMARLQTQQTRSEKPYLEFLHEPSLRVGIYNLPAGATDSQQPHSEDEVYYVLSGRATLRVAGEDEPVSPGSIIFVPAGVEHRFHSIQEELSVLVFFASNAAETS